MTRGGNPVVLDSWEASTATTQNPIPPTMSISLSLFLSCFLPLFCHVRVLTPSYDPGESVFVCFSLYKLSLYLSLSLSIYSFVSLPHLSLSFFSLSSPNSRALTLEPPFPPLLPSLPQSHTIMLCFCF